MEIKLDRVLEENQVKKDSLDVPECFGEYDKESKLCFKYCAISIKCCVMQHRHPKVDILEKLLIYNDYSLKPN
ncbi:MAG: hypothetical protein HUK40_18760 [Desulfobacter sp.]|nr:hypothetical protein [Desulfobacter sp.]WDP86709.1 MAG: hypothetical protein HUN05_17570 [Desulfobacter sp.]